MEGPAVGVPRGVAAKRARSLLDSDNWVARVTGIELLRTVSDSGSAAADAVKIRRLAGDKTTLKGWYGKQKNVPKKDRKKDPSLGQVALEVANHLEGVAKGGKTK